MKIDWAPVLNVVNRHSAQALAVEAVLFCSVGGVFLGYAAAEVLFYGPAIRAFGFFVLGMASLAWGYFLDTDSHGSNSFCTAQFGVAHCKMAQFFEEQ